MTGGGETVTDGEAGRSGGLAPRLVYGLIALGTAATCLVNAFSTAHDLARLGRPVPFWQPFLWEASSGVVIIALAPLVRWIFLRGKRYRDRPALLAGLCLTGALVFSVLHVAGMVLLRKAGYLALSSESYEFGPVGAAFPYELRKDALAYALILVAFWMAERLGVRQVAAPPSSATGSAAIWLRDGTASVKVLPADIAWVASAGNYVEFALGSGEKHLIRSTLQTEEDRLQPLGFVRIHRTRLVNASRIIRIATRPSGDFEVELDTGESLSGSRRYRAEATALVRTPG